MSIPRLHAEGPLIEGAELALTPGQAHHIGTVLRRAAGAELRVFNAAEGEFAATLIALKRDRGALRLAARLRPPEAEPELRLLIAALKREAMDWAIEKATELMLDVHQKGKAVVASDTRERSEMHVFRLHEHGLWATLEHDE